jgi:hypothetical protein
MYDFTVASTFPSMPTSNLWFLAKCSSGFLIRRHKNTSVFCMLTCSFRWFWSRSGWILLHISISILLQIWSLSSKEQFFKKNLRVQSLRVKVCVTFNFMFAVCPYGAVCGYRQLCVFTFFAWFGTPNCIETHNHKPLCPVMNRSNSTCSVVTGV